MKIAYISRGNPLDKKTWSGTHFFMLNELQKHHEVDVIAPVKTKLVVLFKIARRLVRFLFNKNVLVIHNSIVARRLAKKALQRVYGRGYDAVFIPAGAEFIGFFSNSVPIIYLSDAVLPAMLDYYPNFSNVPSLLKKQAVEIERLAIEKSKRIVFSSDWAAQNARSFFNCAPEKVCVIPFGANINAPPSRVRIEAIRSRPIKEVKLLWVGVEWERKGGQFAIDVTKHLCNLSVPSTLTICGTVPESVSLPAFVDYKGYLNKNTLEDYNKLYSSYLHSSFFIFPSKWECSAIVLAEACCFGLPILTFDTGGLSNYVENEYNGYRFNCDTNPSTFAEVIRKICNNEQTYYTYACNSRKKYDTQLRWSVWGEKLTEFINDING